MTALRRGETQAELIERAGMDGYGFNTCVVRSIDHVGRVGVTGVAYDVKWGDCIGLSFCREGSHEWSVMHLSPARARILAMHLLRIAAMKERQEPGAIDAPDKHSLGLTA